MTAQAPIVATLRMIRLAQTPVCDD
jgi:hypothetical protein